MEELEGLTPAALARLVDGSGRARNVWRSLAAGHDPGLDPSLSRSVKARLGETVRRVTLTEDGNVVAGCGTAKLRFALHDGQRIETVVIPSETRSTVCVSTQVGCARGCTFCVTATMGLERGLSAGEIVGQVLAGRAWARARAFPPVTNVVYMGMGEPLDNLDAVRRSIEILCAREALDVGPSHVTLSTVGTSPDAIRETAGLPVQLAWSLHAVDDALRRRLIPTARFAPAELRQAFIDRLRPGNDGLFVEVTLIRDVNDADHHAYALADFLEPFRDCRVNLLPMNSGRAGLEPTTAERAVAFRQVVRSRGRFCAIRRPRGADRSAACGQLAVI